ncbi:unnamed protein product [Arctogadus glacialis]
MKEKDFERDADVACFLLDRHPNVHKVHHQQQIWLFESRRASYRATTADELPGYHRYPAINMSPVSPQPAPVSQPQPVDSSTESLSLFPSPQPCESTPLTVSQPQPVDSSTESLSQFPSPNSPFLEFTIEMEDLCYPLPPPTPPPNPAAAEG